MKLPENVKKIFVVCRAKTAEECRRCPFFELPESRCVCREDFKGILEEVEDILEEGKE